MRYKYKNSVFKVGLLFISVMLVFFIYANLSHSINLFDYDIIKNKEIQFKKSVSKNRTHKKNTHQQLVQINPDATIKVDTTKKRFLLIGDSQVGGFMFPFYDYCDYNGHELLFAQIWYCATDILYGSNDTIKILIQKYKPDHIIMLIGLNQVYQSSFGSSEKAVNNILNNFDTIPYTWIGPASWVADNGITEFYKNNIDEGCFFASDKLKLDRGPDGRHPNKNGYNVWMDSFAKWLQNESIHHIVMNKPTAPPLHRRLVYKAYNASRKNKKNKDDLKTEEISISPDTILQVDSVRLQ